MSLDYFSWRKCCLFLSLRVGAKMIGFLYVIWGLIMTYTIFSVEIHIFWHSKNGTYERNVTVIQSWETAYTLLVVCGLYVLYGAYKEKALFVYCGVILSSAIVIEGVLSWFIALLFYSLHGNHPPNPEQLFEQAISAVTVSYYTLMLHNYYKDLKLMESTKIERMSRLNTHEIGFDVEDLP